jgi:hypothetical protein
MTYICAEFVYKQIARGIRCGINAYDNINMQKIRKKEKIIETTHYSSDSTLIADS